MMSDKELANIKERNHPFMDNIGYHEIEKMLTTIRELKDKLGDCRDKFREYAEQHEWDE